MGEPVLSSSQGGLQSNTQNQTGGSPIDPLAPDAPILHLLSLRENPNVATMSEDELRTLVQRLRTVATSPQSLSAELSKESSRVNPRQRNSISAKRKAILADL
jgi:hypothetical protein